MTTPKITKLSLQGQLCMLMHEYVSNCELIVTLWFYCLFSTL